MQADENTFRLDRKVDDEILGDIQEYVRLAPRENIVNKSTREYTPLLYKDVIQIFRNHGIAIKKVNTIETFMDKHFILRT